MDTLFALPRDEAKKFFTCRTLESLAEFFGTLKENANVSELILGEHCLTLHRALTGGDEPTAGEYPLNHVVLGGRIMFDETAMRVILKRPDMTGHIATELAEVKLETPELAELLATVSSFYQDAAVGGCAVILVRT